MQPAADQPHSQFARLKHEAHALGRSEARNQPDLFTVGRVKQRLHGQIHFGEAFGIGGPLQPAVG